MDIISYAIDFFNLKEVAVVIAVTYVLIDIVWSFYDTVQYHKMKKYIDDRLTFMEVEILKELLTYKREFNNSIPYDGMIVKKGLVRLNKGQMELTKMGKDIAKSL